MAAEHGGGAPAQGSGGRAKEIITRKIGPLPLWAWVAAGAVGVLILRTTGIVRLPGGGAFAVPPAGPGGAATGRGVATGASPSAGGAGGIGSPGGASVAPAPAISGPTGGTPPPPAAVAPAPLAPAPAPTPVRMISPIIETPISIIRPLPPLVSQPRNTPSVITAPAVDLPPKPDHLFFNTPVGGAVHDTPPFDTGPNPEVTPAPPATAPIGPIGPVGPAGPVIGPPTPATPGFGGEVMGPPSSGAPSAPAGGNLGFGGEVMGPPTPPTPAATQDSTPSGGEGEIAA